MQSIAKVQTPDLGRSLGRSRPSKTCLILYFDTTPNVIESYRLERKVYNLPLVE